MSESEDQRASDLIHRHLKIFATSMIEMSIPNAIDGLKFVHRRIITPLRTKWGVVIHSPKLISETAELHPHGGDSIYNAAIRLGQSTEYNPPLLDFHSESSGGTYSNPKPGASRYTALRMPEFLKDVFFDGIEYKALPKQLDEQLSGYEPINYVPSIPIALLYANNTIGYGHPSYTIPHNLGDVCDLAAAYAVHRRQAPNTPFDYVKHVEKFLPDFPTYGILTNPEELIEAYRKGDFDKKICLDGIVQLTEDTITIRSLPYGVPFKKLVDIINDLISSRENKGGWFDKNVVSVKNLSKERDIGKVTVKVKRGVNVFEIWEFLRRKIQFSSTITPIPNYNDGGYAVRIAQPTLLNVWYDARYNILVSSKKIKIMKLTEELRQVEALLAITDYKDEAVAIIKSNTKLNGIALLMKRFDITDFQATFLAYSPLHSLSSTTVEENMAKKDSLETRLYEVKDSFAKIPEEIAAEAMAVKKKYNSPRRTRIPDYIGYVRIGGGCIQYESAGEISQIIADFPKVEMEIHTYDGPHLYKVSDATKLERGSIPKITTGDIYGLKSNTVFTVNITEGTACCVKGFIPGLRTEGYFYTTQRSRAIYRNGEIKTIDVTEEISVRKTICRGASSNIICVYPEIKQDHYVIALNEAMPNIVVLQKVSGDRSKIALSPSGEVRVLHSTSKHIFMNVPQKFLNRNTTRVVEIVDAEKLLEGKSQVLLDIASAKVKQNKLIKLL